MIIRFTFNEVKHILYNYEIYCSGEFPDSVPKYIGVRMPHQERARFEAACLLAAEVALRVNRCWPDGTLVEDKFMKGEAKSDEEVARKYYRDVKETHALINRVVAYCTGRDIGYPYDVPKEKLPISYKDFIEVYRNWRVWRQARMAEKSAKVLTKNGVS